MAIFAIREWDEVFENNRSRACRELLWVPIPARFGDAYLELVRGHENGPAHYAVFVTLVLIAARCEPRGVLVRRGGIGHDPISISGRTGMDPELVTEAMGRLLKPSIRWLVPVEPDGNGGFAVRCQSERQAAVSDLTSTEQSTDDSSFFPSPNDDRSTGSEKSKKGAKEGKGKGTRKRPKTSWPEGWLFGEKEWEAAKRHDCPSRESAAATFEDFESSAESHDYRYANWGAAWNTWCISRKQRKYGIGWPEPGPDGRVLPRTSRARERTSRNAEVVRRIAEEEGNG